MSLLQRLTKKGDRKSREKRNKVPHMIRKQPIKTKERNSEIQKKKTREKEKRTGI